MHMHPYKHKKAQTRTHVVGLEAVGVLRRVLLPPPEEVVPVLLALLRQLPIGGMGTFNLRKSVSLMPALVA